MGQTTHQKRRLNPREVGTVKFLARHHGAGLRFISLGEELRGVAIPLWREGLVEIWYRQMPNTRPSLRGPHFALSYTGQQLAAALQQPRANFTQQGEQP